MINDYKTNTICFSDFLREEYPEEFSQLKLLIEDAGYKVKVLDEADELCCRNYMPVQISKNDFIQFRFGLKNFSSDLYESFDPLKIILINQLTTPRNSNIILDSRNLVRWTDKVIVTDQVYKDNIDAYDSHEAILLGLEQLFQCPVIIIPEHPNEIRKLADSLLRFIDSQHVFINQTTNEIHADWLEEFLDVLQQNGLDYTELPCPVQTERDASSGLYIHYLQVGKLVIVPQNNLPEDGEALEVIRTHLPSDFHVVGYNSEWLSNSGGVLDCVCWSIKA